tara:strand:- start:13 stop:780 length:768 start_codon:yes stop_codon:yes gene_type:complete
MQILYYDKMIIVDSGFGLSLLGKSLEKQQNKIPTEFHIFISHFHWDHIQGLPFFSPIYNPQSILNIYTPAPKDKAEEYLDILFDGSYSPFSGIHNMPSTIIFHQIKQNISVDDLKVSFCELNHPVQNNTKYDKTYAYKFETKFSSITIATDHEASSSPKNERFISFAKNSDILVHNAQLTEDKYYENCGHSTTYQALSNALKIDPGKTLLTHHDPNRVDNDIEKIFQEAQSNPKFKKLNFEFAKEQVVYSPPKKP